jgi:cation:H+ antiporter
MVLLPILLFIVGLLLLILGANFLVKGSSSLAKQLAISEIAIGLTVVAFGTSTPELVVNIFSSVKGYSDIVFGNVIGSNLFNILIILGIAGLINPLTVQKNTVWKEIPFSLFATLLLFVMLNDVAIFSAEQNMLSLIDGIVLILFLIIFLVYVFGISKIKSSDTFDVKVYGSLKTIFYISIGFASLFLGGKFVVDNAVSIARELLVSEKLIALTIVAAGTSLPELATSVVAAVKKRYDIAVGNIIGSNIFNIFFILGVSSIINTAHYSSALNMDFLVLVFGTLLLFLAMFTGRAHRLDRWEAFLFIATYSGYLVYLFYRR